jgi:hypothetical protein
MALRGLGGKLLGVNARSKKEGGKLPIHVEGHEN